MSTTGYIMGQPTVPSGVEVEANGGGGVDTVTIAAGSYTLSSLCTALAAAFNTQLVSTGTWSVSLSTTTGKVTISVSSGTFSITWTSTALRDLLGFDANITSQSTSTGASQARGLWIPDCPIAMDGQPKQGPLVTDLRESEGPTGLVFGIVGNTKYRHRNVRWGLVDVSRVWESEATTTNASWQRFLKDVQLGQGHTWFSPCSRVTIVDHTGTEVGSAESISGWFMKGVRSIEPTTHQDQYTGLWRIQIPELVSDG